MSSIALFRPFMKAEEGKKQSQLPLESATIYFWPSLLDVMGTIVDTAGLYYVRYVRLRQVFQ